MGAHNSSLFFYSCFQLMMGTRPFFLRCTACDVKRGVCTELSQSYGGATAQMGKPRARNNITFKSGFESKEQVEKLDMFRHVPGAKACLGLFKHVHTEDGTCIHCFEVCTGLTLPRPSPVSSSKCRFRSASRLTCTQEHSSIQYQ